MTEYFTRESGIVMGAVVANGPVLGAVVGSFMADDGVGGLVIPDDRQSAFVEAFALALAQGCARADVLMALQVGRAFAKLAGHPEVMTLLFQGIVNLLQPHIVAYFQRVALIDAVPMGSA